MNSRYHSIFNDLLMVIGTFHIQCYRIHSTVPISDVKIYAFILYFRMAAIDNDKVLETS